MRLIDGTGKNSPEEYNAIYFQRLNRGEVDELDLKRWRKLLKFYKGGRLLDMGCLDSLVPSIAKQEYPMAEVWGIDTAEKAIEDMIDRFPDVLYEVGDVYKTGFPNNYFDYIVAGELIEHLDRPDLFMKEVNRILKHGGVFALSTPEEEANEPGAVDGDRHVWSWSVDEVTNLLSAYGSTQIRSIGSQFFPYYIYHWPTIVAYLFKK